MAGLTGGPVRRSQAAGGGRLPHPRAPPAPGATPDTPVGRGLLTLHFLPPFPALPHSPVVIRSIADVERATNPCREFPTKIDRTGTSLDLSAPHPVNCKIGRDRKRLPGEPRRRFHCLMTLHADRRCLTMNGGRWGGRAGRCDHAHCRLSRRIVSAADRLLPPARPPRSRRRHRPTAGPAGCRRPVRRSPSRPMTRREPAETPETGI